MGPEFEGREYTLLRRCKLCDALIGCCARGVIAPGV